MAKGVIGNLRVNMGLDSAQFQAGMAKVSKGMDGLAKKAAVFGAAVGAAMTAAAGAMAVAVNNVINRADQLGDVADRLGVGVAALQELRHAAERTGMGVQNFDVALRRFIRRASEAALGTGAAKTAFEQLGITLRDSKGNLKPTEDLLNEVADAMQRVPTQADRLRLAFQMFDTDGAAMLNMLQEGSVGINRLREEARNLGIVLSEETVRGAQAFKDNLDIIGKVKDGLVTKITAHLLPALELLSERFMGFVNDEKTMVAVADGIGKAFEWVWKVALRLKAGIRSMSVEIAALGEVALKISQFDPLGALEAWNTGQAKASQILADMEKQIAEGLTSGLMSQGQIQRRIDMAFGGAGEKSGETFTNGFKKAGAKIKAAIDPLAQEAARIFEATRTPLEQYQAQIARLNELLQQGYINQDTYNRAVAQAQDAFAQAEKAGKKTENVFQQIGQSMAYSFSSAFQGLIDGSKRVQDVLKDLLNQLTNMLMNRAFQAILGGLFGGGDLFGSNFRNMIGYANGTNNARRGVAWVGERGPELVRFRGGEQVIPNHALGAGGAGTTVNVIDNAGVQKREERTRGPDGREMINVILDRVKQDFASGGFDTPMAARYGGGVAKKIR